MSFTGILIEQSTGSRAYTYPSGFRGISLEYPSGIRFIKVTDYRGNPLSGVAVTVQNAGGDYTNTTDLTGIAAVEIDVAGTVTILLQKNKTNGSLSYTYASEGLNKEVVLQPRLL